MEWNEALKKLKVRLGCTSSQLAHVFEISVPVMTSWIKGYDSKNNPTTPTFVYAAIILRATKISDTLLKNAFNLALKRPRMSNMEKNTALKNSTRHVSYNNLVMHQPSSVQIFIENIYSN